VRVLFASDVHLSALRPRQADAFVRFLAHLDPDGLRRLPAALKTAPEPATVGGVAVGLPGRGA